MRRKNYKDSPKESNIEELQSTYSKLSDTIDRLSAQITSLQKQNESHLKQIDTLKENISILIQRQYEKKTDGFEEFTMQSSSNNSHPSFVFLQPVEALTPHKQFRSR